MTAQEEVASPPARPAADRRSGGGGGARARASAGLLTGPARLRARLLGHPGACATALFFAMTAVVSAVAAWALTDSRLDARRHAVQSVANVATVLRRDIERNLEVLDLSLQGVADGLRTPGLSALPASIVHQLLFDRAATAHDLGRILVLDREGRVTRSSDPRVMIGESHADQDYFRVHRDGGGGGSAPAAVPFLSQQAASTSSGERALFVSRPLLARGTDGAFAGVVVGSLKLAYVGRLFAGVHLGPGSSLALFHADTARLLVREPPPETGGISEAMPEAQLFRYASGTDTGWFDAASQIDGVRRLHVHQRLGSLPLRLSVAIPDSAVYAEWWQKVVIVTVTGLLLCLLSSILVRFALLHLRTRLDAERRTQGERMQALARLTAGVAHDFNNLLQTVLGSLEVLREKPGLDADGRDWAALATRAARRGATLTRRMLAFTGQQPLSPKALHVPELLKGLRMRLGLVLGTDTRLELRIASGTWPIHADPNELEASLLHLAINARDAMPRGGVLRVSAANAGFGDPRPPGLAAGDWVRLVIEDTGQGMDADTAALAFEPFFTTKEVGKGSGLGLSMVQGFARQSGGDAIIQSTPGRGTAVELWLPRAPDPVERTATPTVVVEPVTAPPTAAVAPERLSPRRLLVVDDEVGVRRTLAMMLVRAGYEVETAEGGPEALERLRSGERFDLLLTDQSMPDMSGVELLEQALPLCPGLPAAVVTGYDRVRGLDRLPVAVPVLHKPVDRLTFLAAVAQLLAVPPSLPPGSRDAAGQPDDRSPHTLEAA